MTRKIILLLILLNFSLYGMGLKVSPGTILLREFPVGDSFDFEEKRNLTLTIKNDNSSTYKYAISPEKPSQSNSDATGYFDIADPDWFSVEPATLSIEAHDVGYAKMYMEIPEDENWYNRHWLLGVSILPISSSKRQGTSIALGGYLLYRFETESKRKLSIYPKCETQEIVPVPSRVHFDSVEPGKTYIKKVRLAHSYTHNKKFEAYPLPPSSEVAKLTILTKSPYTRLQNHSWLEYDKDISLRQDQFSDFVLRLHIPENASKRTNSDATKKDQSGSGGNGGIWEVISSPFTKNKGKNEGDSVKASQKDKAQVEKQEGKEYQYKRKKWEEIIMFKGNNTKKSFLRVLITLK